MNVPRTDARPGGVASWLSVWARRRPDHPCVVFEDRPLSYAEFDRRITHLAGVFVQLGVSQGDRIGCLMPNRPEYLVSFCAALRLGAIFVPYNVRLVATELAVVIEDSEPTIVVTDVSFASTLARVDEIRPTRWLDIDSVDTEATPVDFDVPWLSGDDPAAIVYTSGTTGRSKGAVLTHGNFLHQSLAWSSGFGLGAADVQINLMSLCYTAGLLNPNLTTFQTGATVVLEPRFDAASALRQIERWGVTWITATPEIVRAILEHPNSAGTDLSSLKRIQTGGTRVPLEMAEQAARRGIDLIQGYGITEASAGINVFLPSTDLLRKSGSIGLPGPYDEVRVVDGGDHDLPVGEIGEMLLRGPLVMQGYWRNPVATAETLAGGWLHTGDLARFDDDGFVTLVGRKKEMIISGGLNVYPIEVEQVLATFPEIAEVAVVGLPDEQWGERVSAFVILQAGERLTEADFIEQCRSQLAGYRIPRTVVFVDDFPRTASGKIQKPKLVERWAQAQT